MHAVVDSHIVHTHSKVFTHSNDSLVIIQMHAGNVDGFLKSLINFDKDNTPENCVAVVEKGEFCVFFVQCM